MSSQELCLVGGRGAQLALRPPRRTACSQGEPTPAVGYRPRNITSRYGSVQGGTTGGVDSSLPSELRSYGVRNITACGS